MINGYEWLKVDEISEIDDNDGMDEYLLEMNEFYPAIFNCTQYMVILVNWR
jgi:hypothetical protein